MLKDLIFTKPNELWAISKNNIIQFHIENERVTSKKFKELDELPIGEINSLWAKGGDLWIASTNGIIYFPLNS